MKVRINCLYQDFDLSHKYLLEEEAWSFKAADEWEEYIPTPC